MIPTIADLTQIDLGDCLEKEREQARQLLDHIRQYGLDRTDWLIYGTNEGDFLFPADDRNFQRIRPWTEYKGDSESPREYITRFFWHWFNVPTEFRKTPKGVYAMQGAIALDFSMDGSYGTEDLTTTGNLSMITGPLFPIANEIGDERIIVNVHRFRLDYDGWHPSKRISAADTTEETVDKPDRLEFI